MAQISKDNKIAFKDGLRDFDLDDLNQISRKFNDMANDSQDKLKGFYKEISDKAMAHYDYNNQDEAIERLGEISLNLNELSFIYDIISDNLGADNRADDDLKWLFNLKDKFEIFKSGLYQNMIDIN